MDYEKKYKRLYNFISDLYPFMSEYCKEKVEGFLPELCESEDEKIRKFLIKWIQDNYYHGTTEIPTKTLIAWLEKQGSEPNWCHHKVDLSNCSEEYRKAYYDGWNNCNQQHSQCKSDGNDIVKCLINGMKFYYEDNEEATWGTEKFSLKVKDILSWLEKQRGEMPADKVEPKFKVKYAGSEYNVLEVKDIAGVTYYGIEDEPNHIDYVLPDNCEIISGYSVKEKGSPYPTKSAIFSEQNPALSEENDNDAWMNDIISKVENNLQLNKAEIDWLKSLKERCAWKPSIAQLNALSIVSKGNAPDDIEAIVSLYNDLKKLTEE